MNAKSRQVFYSLGTIASAVLTLLVLFKVIDSGTAASLTSIVGALSGLLGTAAAGTAAVVTQKQINNGTLDPANNAVDRTVTGLQDVAKTYNDLVSQVTGGVQRVQDAAGALVSVASVGASFLPGSLAEAAAKVVADKDSTR